MTRHKLVYPVAFAAMFLAGLGGGVIRGRADARAVQDRAASRAVQPLSAATDPGTPGPTHACPPGHPACGRGCCEEHHVCCYNPHQGYHCEHHHCH